MKWRIKEAEFGDAVRVKLGGLYHYGIYASDEEVIQFGLPPSPDRRAQDVEVTASDVSDFLSGGFMEVGRPEGKERRMKRPGKEVVAAARARMGEKGYDLIRNNCEHFVNSCLFGKSFSTQTDGMRAHIRAIPTVDVYVAKFPFPTENDEIYPPERAAEIEACKNDGAREEKFYVWKLLEHGIKRSFGINIRNVDIKCRRGKWYCADCEFSLSHSGDAVAVAVSDKPIGVDIEKFELTRFSAGLRKKIFTAREAKAAAELTEAAAGEYANRLWTVKEAAYKSGAVKSFAPSKIETENVTNVSKRVKTDKCEYILTVVSQDAERAVFGTYGENLIITE